jgi:hypothetical protein
MLAKAARTCLRTFSFINGIVPSSLGDSQPNRMVTARWRRSMAIDWSVGPFDSPVGIGVNPFPTNAIY